MASWRRVREQSRISARASRSIPLIAAGQAVEHYEMARYGALIAWAGQLNMPKAAALLNESLQEEMKAEKLLTQIGTSKADKMAATKMAAYADKNKSWAGRLLLPSGRMPLPPRRASLSSSALAKGLAIP